MYRMLAILGCCLLVAACSTTPRYTKLAAWDTMYYYDPYTTAEAE